MNVQKGDVCVLEQFSILDIKDRVDQEASRDGSNNVAAGDNFYIVSDHNVRSLFSGEDNL